ncbi:lipoprotein NlpI [Bradyrhizobium sp. GM2.2]|jgi:lipoprotein NlpI|uniref:Peptidase C14 caspase domain-containing protein n=1 Tax=Bradyrhizobium canariense TaxID=255045 RepID=A0A1X3G068_9BRAD|nr:MULTISPECIES: caspase family protein [Bradyrhizobium]MCK1268859.1 caspase family protein [Bradyrhizobium sp. 84]MCK1305882.1 caspase family protein [Bradyrhizobium sp. 45]MCK1315789.1 caspase family protein [Bradyrhizobium sp. 23]MCK1319583.1 caspase family protein [Bradyrhizobium sp. 156]MCK1328474.1 caspase family protein [Bradyrhizobium sp. CW9]
MKIRLLFVLSLLVSLIPTAPSLAAGDRFALVIGNAKYPDADAPLKEPLNDARDVADELKRDGFSVEIGENLTGDGMRRAFDKLYGKIKPGSVALVFFSGFGIQSARQSYLLPIDAQIWTESDVRRDGISLETVLGELNTRGAGVKIALVDASRRNPFERRFRSFSAGLTPVIAPNGTLVMYSAALASVVSDAGGEHSLFVQELLKEIRVPDLMAEETLNRTKMGVTRASRGEQVPWISSSLAEDFSFIPGAGGSRPTTTPPPAPPPPPVVANNPPPTPPAPSPPPPPKPAETVAAPAPSPKPQVEAALPPAPPPPPPVIPADPATAPTMESGPSAAALAEDPTIKGLTAKIAANPDDVNALYRRGQVYASKGAYSLAIKDFDETLRINPKDVEALNNRCWTRTVVGDLQGALKDCNEALRLRPNFVDALDSRGLVNLKSGAVKNAIADFEAALRINPRLTSSLFGRGIAKQRNGSAQEGALDIANAKAMDPNIVQEFASYGVR